MGRIIVAAQAEGPVLAAAEGLSFWGGVDPVTGRVIDAHHPLHGETVAGKVVVMPTSRGSCSGSGVLLELALNGHAPAALVFREAEDILTLGALVAGRMFGRPLPVLRLRAGEHDRLATAAWARISPTALEAGDWHLPLVQSEAEPLDLTAADRSMLAGADGPAAQLAIDILCAMARAQGARTLCDVTRAHIDGCIYASPANLTFAETMAEMGARVRIPTTMNAISVDHDNWRGQGVPPVFGGPASRLADAYVAMGAQPSFTCAPYQLEAPAPPGLGEAIGWSESNAVIYANSVLGARTVKHPDFLDLCIAVTGRAPHTGVYRAENRSAHSVIEVEVPYGHDDAFWPLLGWLAGRAAPAAIPLLRGLSAAAPDADALKALCAAFGTTSAAPMLHIQGVTPEAHLPVGAGAKTTRITRHHMADLWRQFNAGPAAVDLVAIGSPHASAAECEAVAQAFAGRRCAPGVTAIITLGRETLGRIRDTGVLARLEGAGVRVLPDLCWCSISEPVFPSTARVLMTNSGKYAHYAPGLSGRAVRFGGIAACVETAVTGRAPEGLPPWLEPA